MSQQDSVFQRAKATFLRYAAPLDLDRKYPNQHVLDRLTTPDKSMIFRLSLQMDDGSIRLLNAFRVQFNDDCGPYKGGLRFHPNVNLDEVTALAFWMYIKTAVVGLPFGGGKGGVAVDYKNLSLSEKERLTKKFALIIRNDVGPDTDIPAPDVNTGPREMAWMLDAFRMSRGEYQHAIITGKPVDLGGSLGRTEATGRGAVITLFECARDIGINPAGATAAVQGFGNVGQWAALDMAAAGTKIIAVCDSQTGLVDESGLDIPMLVEHKNKTGALAGLKKVKKIPPAQVLATKCDFLVPAALEDAITVENAKDIKARIVSEGANGPTTFDAGQILYDRGVKVVPDVLANAGGVLVSYFEWVQNRQEFYWSEQEVNDRLRDRMTKAYRIVADRAREDKAPLRQAAYTVAIERVVRAAVERGVQ